MHHKKANRILGRTSAHRHGLLKNLSSALLEHGFVVTTKARASELRKHFEPLVTKAKGELTLARRRELLSKLQHKTELEPLITIASEHKTRPGGYLRLTKLPTNRHDNADQVRVDVIHSGTAQ